VNTVDPPGKKAKQLAYEAAERAVLDAAVAWEAWREQWDRLSTEDPVNEPNDEMRAAEFALTAAVRAYLKHPTP